MNLPALVYLENGNGEADNPVMGYLADRSRDGARIVLDEPVHPGESIRFEVPGAALAEEGSVVSVRLVATPVGQAYVLGVRTLANGASGTGSAEGPHRRRAGRRGKNSQKG